MNQSYLEPIIMGCLRLTYREKEEGQIFLTLGEKRGIPENCNDYYPFGLTFNSYSRENSVANKYKFQGQEHIDDLDLGWDSFKWRNHQPDIGRFFNVDPLAEKYYYNSPYAFSENKVVAHIELEGLEAVPFGAGTNPLKVIGEGFRRIGDAFLSLFTVKGEVYGKASDKKVDVSLGNNNLSITATTKKSAFVSFDFSDILNPPANNEFILPNNIFDAGTRTDVTSTEAVKNTIVVGDVPVNTTVSSTQNMNDQSVTNTTEVSVGVDKGNVQANVFVSNSTTTQSNGSTSNKTSAGVRVETPVYKEGSTTFSIGSQITLEREMK